MASDYYKLLMIIFFALFGLIAQAASHTPALSSVCFRQVERMQWRFCDNWFNSPYVSRNRQQQQVVETPQFLAECCAEVGKITTECKCEIILYKFSQYHGSRNLNQIRAKARDLPRRCQWKTPTHCHIP